MSALVSLFNGAIALLYSTCHPAEKTHLHRIVISLYLEDQPPKHQIIEVVHD